MAILHTVKFIMPDTSSSFARRVEIYLTQSLNPGSAEREYARRLTTLINSLSEGSARGHVLVHTSDQVMGSGTLTFASPTDGDAFKVCQVTFTAKTGAIAGNQFKIDNSDTVTARNAAAAVNAITTGTISSLFASTSGAVLTLFNTSPAASGSDWTISGTNGASGSTRIASGSSAVGTGSAGKSTDLGFGWIGNPITYPNGSTS